MKVYPSLTEIIHPYTHVLLDMWGVVHDGHVPYKNAIRTLEYLKSNGKEILFLTNSPRSHQVLGTLINKMGIPSSLYHSIYSSGNATIDYISNPQYHLKDKSFYFISDHLHEALVHEIPGTSVTQIRDADYILLTKSPSSYAIFDKALAKKLPVLCANPDLVAIEKGVRVECPGAAAAYYESKGGPVIYLGKPYPYIYENALKSMGSPPLQKVVAIGDGLYTDILGAKRMGIDSIFIKGGVHGHESDKEILKKCDDLEAHPTYILDLFH